ncbi:MAG TPA: translation initiation factor IF-2 associated domain-containing protein, partial [Rhodocyclaceae bacterium]|nr:translation initiation factor IF-2 associated domain-containing protein [Rhodocyclaceae bacterium]
MEEMSVTQFAGELKMPETVLLEQLQKAGVVKSGVEDLLTEQDKAKLLEYLRRAHGETRPKGKITLTRRQTSEIRATDSSGRARTVQVEVRKKRVFVKRDELTTDSGSLDTHAEIEPEVESEAVSTQAAEPQVEVATAEMVEESHVEKAGATGTAAEGEAREE